MDLSRMNRIAANVLLGGFAIFLVIMIFILYNTGAENEKYRTFFWPFVSITSAIGFGFLIYSLGTLKGASAHIWGGQSRILLNYRIKETPRDAGVKFFIFFLCGIFFTILINPRESLIQSILWLGIVFILFDFWILWALEYDPLPASKDFEKDYFTTAELADSLSREIVISLPYNIAFSRCSDLIRSIWGAFSLPEENRENGTIDLMYAGSHLAFQITRISETRTKIFFSILPDLPQKWNPEKDRRENILYLKRILAELTGEEKNRNRK